MSTPSPTRNRCPVLTHSQALGFHQHCRECSEIVKVLTLHSPDIHIPYMEPQLKTAPHLQESWTGLVGAQHRRSGPSYFPGNSARCVLNRKRDQPLKTLSRRSCSTSGAPPSGFRRSGHGLLPGSQPSWSGQSPKSRVCEELTVHD